MDRNGIGNVTLSFGAILMALGGTGSAHAAPDPGKKACVREARILCPAEMKSMSRKKVETCMIAKVEKTSPLCKASMYKIKAEREAMAAAKSR